MSDTTQHSFTKPTDAFSQFEREYFVQTRKEIDTEKQERNKILNYAILATGAVSLVLSKPELCSRQKATG
ncbi:MAG TPA: hypothetical protein VL486_16585 [Verrucomicrobiae bacterium]|nr:hypothetical protein [Verrucomicrobiae bacterium]